jgi:hypothetical protein
MAVTSAPLVADRTRQLLQRSVFAVLVLVGVIASVLSWDALVAVGRAAYLDTHLATLYPATVDALCVTSAVAVVVLQPHGWRVRAYPAGILAAFVILSTAGNGVHAWTRGGRLVLPQAVAVIASAVPPVSVAAVIYLLMLLLRPVPASPAGDPGDAKATHRRTSPNRHADRDRHPAGPIASTTNGNGTGPAVRPTKTPNNIPDPIPTTPLSESADGNGHRLTYPEALAVVEASGERVTDKAVARIMGVSDKTVQRHRAKMAAAANGNSMGD